MTARGWEAVPTPRIDADGHPGRRAAPRVQGNTRPWRDVGLHIAVAGKQSRPPRPWGPIHEDISFRHAATNGRSK